jgi:chromatin segregation and condensation protein Rec8/ScpA/Scc1 (kleisin family)
VSVYDLVEALEKALEMDARRPIYLPPRTLDTINPPEHHIDISVIIREVYDRIYGHYEVTQKKDQLMFHHIARSTDRQDMVMTFIPLLHLENARKVEMEQPEHFGPINIHLIDRAPPAYLVETQTRITEEPIAKEIQVKLAPQTKPTVKKKKPKSAKKEVQQAILNDKKS